MSITLTLEEEPKSEKGSNLPSSQSRKLAQDKGWEFHTPADHELFLDFDDSFQSCMFDETFPQFQEAFPGSIVTRRTPSKSGVGEHVVIQLVNNYDVATRIALQACLYSDPIREMLSILKVQSKDPDPIAFFELPGVVKK